MRPQAASRPVVGQERANSRGCSLSQRCFPIVHLCHFQLAFRTFEPADSVNTPAVAAAAISMQTWKSLERTQTEANTTAIGSHRAANQAWLLIEGVTSTSSQSRAGGVVSPAGIVALTTQPCSHVRAKAERGQSYDG